jgi:spore germination protein GerM
MKRCITLAALLFLLSLACDAIPQPPLPVTPILTAAVPTVQPPTATVEQPTSTPDLATVFVYFTISDPVTMKLQPVPRQVPASGDIQALLQATLLELLKGPTDAEKAQGLHSWFSPATASTLKSVAVSAQGVATADFTQWQSLISNASTSAGSYMLISQLNSTVFQFPTINQVWYSLEGNCQTFWEWLQSACHGVNRVEWEQEPTQ